MFCNGNTIDHACIQTASVHCTCTHSFKPIRGLNIINYTPHQGKFVTDRPVLSTAITLT